MSNKSESPHPADGDCCTPLVERQLDESDAADLAHLLKALGEPVRLRLVSMIGSHEGGEACVCDLSEAFPLTQPTISHHLKVLREAGLLESERRATWVYYRIVPGRLNQLSGLLAVPRNDVPKSTGVDLDPCQ